MSCVRPGASSDGSWMPVGAGAARATARLPRHPAEGDPFRRSADVIGPICQRLERFAKDGAALRCNPPDSKRATILAPQNCLFTGPCTRDHGSGTQAFAPGVATPGANALVIRLSSAEQWQRFFAPGRTAASRGWHQARVGRCRSRLGSHRTRRGRPLEEPTARGSDVRPRQPGRCGCSVVPPSDCPRFTVGRRFAPAFD